jgi:hypothetical protein
MTTKFVILFVLAGACLSFSCKAARQTESSSSPTGTALSGTDQTIQLLRQDIQSERKQLIAANLKLTADQATRFWPVYDQYAAELSKIGDERVALIKEYAEHFGNMTDERALSLSKRALAVDEEVPELHNKYLPIFGKAVPGVTVASFFQLDRLIQGLIDLQVASQIPLVQAQK